MPAKIITLSQKDQDLLRVAFEMVIPLGRTPEQVALVARIKDLKERIL